MGHIESACPLRRRAEREARTAEAEERRVVREARLATRVAEGPLCNLCFQRGHTAADCSGRCRPRCLACGEEGHVQGSSQCHVRQSAVAAIGVAVAAPRRAVLGSKEVKDVEEEPNADTCSESTTSLSTVASSSLVPAEAREIRRLEKKLRGIGKLEERLAAGEHLDALQRAKIEQRSEAEIDLESARGLAQARVRGAASAASAHGTTC